MMTPLTPEYCQHPFCTHTRTHKKATKDNSFGGNLSRLFDHKKVILKVVLCAQPTISKPTKKWLDKEAICLSKCMGYLEPCVHFFPTSDDIFLCLHQQCQPVACWTGKMFHWRMIWGRKKKFQLSQLPAYVTESIRKQHLKHLMYSDSELQKTVNKWYNS